MEGSGGIRPNVGVLLEQTLGHVSHGKNVRKTLSETEKANVTCAELPYEPSGVFDLVPPRSNWTMRSSLAARAAVRNLERRDPLDALFVHTHVPATLLGRTMERVPTVVSIDATPRQIDSLGGSYRHSVHPGVVENAKWQLHARCFQRASSLVSWSKWAADSLVADYGVNRDKIEVIPPGVTPSMWRRPGRRSAGTTVRILFVGGDFQRKGGDVLLEAVQLLRNDPEVLAGSIDLELHLVTSADVEPRPGVFVHRGLTPNDPELIALFHDSDIFALPTFGDCTPLVLAEAATAGLPSVATDVGAIGESVIDGVTGHLVEPNAASLAAGLRPLVLDSDHRLQLGENAAAHAARTMDADKNALRLLDGVVESARSHHSSGRTVLTVSGDVAHDVEEATSAGIRPLADYSAIVKATDADLLDWGSVRREGCNRTEWIRKIAGNSVAMAYHLYRHRHDFEVIITDGEQVGLPLAAMFQLGGGRGRVRHVMIGHRLSPLKKTLPTRLLHLAKGVDEILVYSSHQAQVAEDLFDRKNNRVRLIDFMVDSEFFRPTRALNIDPSVRRPKLCTAGREFRDYPTLIEAVRDLDVDVVIASASPWSRRADNAQSSELPPNVTVTSLSQSKLRDQMDDADIVVLPLLDTDFQAGVTTLLEAMSMERPVICTYNAGQSDVVVDGENGLYVPVGDAAALRKAITDLVEAPDRAIAMGKQGRRLIEERADVRRYARLFADIVASHTRRRPTHHDVTVSPLQRRSAA